MSKSLLQTHRECYITRRTDGLHRHHIYGGQYRELSEQYGCWVYLIGELHNLSGDGVHFNSALNLRLKRACQKAFERKYSHKKFMELFEVNYLERNR